MTLPGLALFYAGLGQAKNVLSVLIHGVTIAALATVFWVVCGYSLALEAGNAFIGGLDRVLLAGMARDSVFPGTALPESVFVMFQMTFAIITRSEEHTSELQSLMRISYAVFCLKKKKTTKQDTTKLTT